MEQNRKIGYKKTVICPPCDRLLFIYICSFFAFIVLRVRFHNKYSKISGF